MPVVRPGNSQLGYSKRTVNEILRAQLENERSSFLAHWRDLGDNILPRRPRFYTADTNRGERRNLKIIDSTATLSLRTLRSGMMGGITSPARPWFRLAFQQAEANKSDAVKAWLDEVSQIMYSTFLRSNLYNVLPIVYGDIGVFGTAAMFMEEDFDNVVKFQSLPIGSYSIGSSDGMKVDIIIREFRMTIRQVIEKFGEKDSKGMPILENFSEYIQAQYRSRQLESWVDVCHVIKPNLDHDPEKNLSKYKKYMSVYYEKGSLSLTDASAGTIGLNDDRLLRESGYDYFPVLIPRWETTGEDWWGTDCPGMVALGDIKQLQLGEKRSVQALEKMVNPPMVAPNSMKNAKASILPGDITYSPSATDGSGFRPAHEIRFSITELENKQQQIRQRISRSFYEDLFLMLANSDRRQITAREIEERHEEKLLALGPVLEQLNQDLLDPLIDNTFDILVRQGKIPDPPQEIEGIELKVEYISIMAEAQKLVGLGGIERFTRFASELLPIYPEVKNKIDHNKLVSIYGEMTSLPPGILRSDEDTAALEAQQMEALKQQQQMEQMQQGAGMAKDLSQTNMGEESALSGVVDALGSGVPEEELGNV